MQLKYFNEKDDPLIKGLNDELLLMLDSARTATIALIITSGLRSPGGNSVLKGAVPDSSHLTGDAVDLHVEDDFHFRKMLHGLDKAGFRRFGLYFSVDPVTKILIPRHIHVDIDETKPQDSHLHESGAELGGKPMFDNFFASIAGKFAASKLNLQEGAPMPTKPWYQSKTVWSDVVTILLAILGFVDKTWTGGHIVSSPFYSMALTFLGAMGIYDRTTATTTISS